MEGPVHCDPSDPQAQVRLAACLRVQARFQTLAFRREAALATYRRLLPRVNADQMCGALAGLAAHADPGGRKLLVMLVDDAGWNLVRRPAVPANVALHFLPPGTPELQPDEPLWTLIRETAANWSIGRIDRLRAIVRALQAYLAQHPGLVQPVVGFR
jgi:hypothetical protein